MKFEGGRVIGAIDINRNTFSRSGSHWNCELSASKLTEDEILQLDTSIAKDEYVSLKDAKFAREFGFTGGLKTGRTSNISTDDMSDIVFKGKYKDFKPEDGDYVLQQPIGIPYLSRYRDGKIVGELADHSKKFITTDTWEPRYNIEARKATPIETRQLDACILEGKYVSVVEVEPDIWNNTEIGDFVLYNELGDHTLVRNTLEEQVRVLLNVKLVYRSPYNGSDCSFKPATEEQSTQLDACISKGRYVSLEEALARDSGTPDAIIKNSEGNLVPVDFKSHNAVFDQNCNAILGVSSPDNRLYLDEIKRLKEIIDRQQEEINKLSQTWTQKLKNMIGPLV